MRDLLRLVDRVTGSDVPVLVIGESGTGKELVARAIHANGARARRAFVTENCASVPESLLESTLFGHVRGAFTGASSTRAGLFDVADGGTLFLDEIGEMSLGMQAKLLRVLQDGEVRAVGSERARRVDVRVIAATHRDLEAMVAAGTFREDLFYRLNVITLRVPALRERPEDIPLLFEHFARKHGAGRPVKITRAAMAKLIAFPWPGNVRQLENEVRRALVLSDGAIDLTELSADVVRGGPSAAPGRRAAPALARRCARVVPRPRGPREDPRQPDARRADARPLALRAAEDDQAPGGEGRRIAAAARSERAGRRPGCERPRLSVQMCASEAGGPSVHTFLFPIKSGL